MIAFDLQEYARMAECPISSVARYRGFRHFNRFNWFHEKPILIWSTAAWVSGRQPSVYSSASIGAMG